MTEFHVINLWHNGSIGEMNIYTGNDYEIEVRIRPHFPTYPWYQKLFWLFVRSTKLKFSNYKMRVNNRGIRNE